MRFCSLRFFIFLWFIFINGYSVDDKRICCFDHAFNPRIVYSSSHSKTAILSPLWTPTILKNPIFHPIFFSPAVAKDWVINFFPRVFLQISRLGLFFLFVNSWFVVHKFVGGLEAHDNWAILLNLAHDHFFVGNTIRTSNVAIVWCLINSRKHLEFFRVASPDFRLVRFCFFRHEVLLACEFSYKDRVTTMAALVIVIAIEGVLRRKIDVHTLDL